MTKETSSDEFKSSSSFAPVDPLDGRKVDEWETKYPKEAKTEIRKESWYLAFLLFLNPLLMLMVWIGIPNLLLNLTPSSYSILQKGFYSLLGGLLGGTCFSIKWLYHSVAKKIWHLDRRLWRCFTPHVSGAFAFAFYILISSGIIKIFDPNALKSSSSVVGFGFLVGYFSDMAMGKLSELAEIIFGNSVKDKKTNFR